RDTAGALWRARVAGRGGLEGLDSGQGREYPGRGHGRLIPCVPASRGPPDVSLPENRGPAGRWERGDPHQGRAILGTRTTGKVPEEEFRRDLHYRAAMR